MTFEPTSETQTSNFSHPAPPPSTHDDDPPRKTHRSQSKQRSSGSSNSKKKSQTKSKKKKQPYKPAYLDAIQQEIDDLKEQDEKDNGTSTAISKLEELKLKLSTPEMLQKSGRDRDQYAQPTSRNSTEQTIRFEQETLTLLHFFYIVRLAQKGFFYVISQSYPDVEPKALVHLCDRLVGGSLFVVKDPMEQVRSNKRIQVFDLLQKLHDGAPEPIDDGFSTTFKQVRHLVFDFIESTLPSKTQQDNQLAQYQDQGNDGYNDKGPSPVWVMVPFHGMIEGVPEVASSPPVSIGQRQMKIGSQEKNGKQASPGNDNSALPSSAHKDRTSGHVNGSTSPKESRTTETGEHHDTKCGNQEQIHDLGSNTHHTKEPIDNEPTSDHDQSASTNEQVTGSDHTNEDVEASSGWTSTLATTPSSSWSQGNQDQKTEASNDGWGSPVVDDNVSPPEWSGKLPDDLINPGDETITGDVSGDRFSRPWQDNRRGGPRGRSSGFRGSGRGNYRSFGDDFRGGRGRGGPRRGGSSSSGWNTTRPPRSE